MKNKKKLLIAMMCVGLTGNLIACAEDTSNDSNVNSATDGTKDEGMLEEAADKVEDEMKDGADEMQDGADDMVDDAEKEVESEDMNEEEKTDEQ